MTALQAAVRPTAPARAARILALWRLGWTYRAISGCVGVSHGIIRAVLDAAGVPGRPLGRRPMRSPGTPGEPCAPRRWPRKGCHCASCVEAQRVYNRTRQRRAADRLRASDGARSRGTAWRCWACGAVGVSGLWDSAGYRLVLAGDRCPAGHPAPWVP